MRTLLKLVNMQRKRIVKTQELVNLPGTAVVRWRPVNVPIAQTKTQTIKTAKLQNLIRQSPPGLN